MEDCAICGGVFDMEKEGGIKNNRTKKAVCASCMRKKPKEVGRLIAK